MNPEPSNQQPDSINQSINKYHAAAEKIKQIHAFTEEDLLKNVLPYWIKYVPDDKNGGFYGRITNDQVS